MNPKLKALLTLIAAAAILGAGLAGYRVLKARQQPAAQPGAAKRISRVHTAPVTRGTVTHHLVLTGDIEAIRTVDLKPKLSARLERLALDNGTPVLEGTAVRSNEVVAVLDHRDLEAQAAQARAALAISEAALQDAGREKARVENLLKEGSSTEQARDRAVNAYERAVAGAAQARAVLNLAEVTLSEAFLRAPMDGVVSAKYMDPGAMVNPSMPILRIVPMDEVRILVGVPSLHLGRLAAGVTPVELAVDTWPDRPLTGLVSKIHPTVDPATRTATLEIRVPNPRTEKGEYFLRPGMYASLRILVDRRENVLVVPADALVRRLDRFLAFVVADGRAQARTVRPGLRDGPNVEILEGLKEGEALVVSGHTRLTDQAAVEVMDRPEAAPAAAGARP